ncbi:glutaredoxin family protein [Priestia megaterium]|uniref:glutaredoxin family protein n=1 Tax=Priestia megaterium TaxID=1404 RepID=UPI003CE9C090
MVKEIKLYSNDNCGYCVKLKKWLDERNIVYQNFNTSDPEVSKELINQKIQGIPYMIVTNSETEKKTRILGFDPKKLKHIFG